MKKYIRALENVKEHYARLEEVGMSAKNRYDICAPLVEGICKVSVYDNEISREEFNGLQDICTELIDMWRDAWAKEIGA